MKIIYLAAGNSRRFFSQKLFYEFAGKPLYLHGLDTLRKLVAMRDDCSIRVVYQDERIINGDEEYVYSPLSKEGVSYSIKKGIEGIEEDCMFVVADQPYINVNTLNEFIDSFYKQECLGASLICKGTVGNPTIFSSQLLPELNKLEKDQGGRKVLKKIACYYHEIDDINEFKDIDTIEDLGD